jgi:hypothetical protein
MVPFLSMASSWLLHGRANPEHEPQAMGWGPVMTVLMKGGRPGPISEGCVGIGAERAVNSTVTTESLKLRLPAESTVNEMTSKAVTLF